MTDTDSPPEPIVLAYLEAQRSHDKPEASVIMYEDWDERPDGIYYKWRFEGEKEWNEKLTPYTQKPYIRFKRLSQAEVRNFYMDATDVRSESPHGTKDEVNTGASS